MPQSPSKLWPFEETVSLVVVAIKSLATAARYPFHSGSKSYGKNFAMTFFMPRSSIKTSDTVVSESPDQLLVFCQLLMFVDCSPYTFNILRCSACWRPSTTRITFSRFLTIFEVSVLHFYLHCTHCIIAESLWIIGIVSTEECSSLTQTKIWCRFIALLAHSVWMQWPHSTHAYSMASTAPTD